MSIRPKNPAVTRVTDAVLTGSGGGPFTKHQRQQVRKERDELPWAAAEQDTTSEK